MRSVRPTSIRLLAVVVSAGLLLGAGLPVLVRRLGGDVPLLSWGPATLLAIAAGIVGVVAWSTWKSVHRDHQRVNADRALFHLALAHASSRVGALFLGGYAGFALAYVDLWETTNGRDRVLHGGGAAVAAALLMLAGLLMERACRLPTDDDEDEDDDGSRSKATPSPT
ncbi:DUF3180 domain-containing protein [Aeromicrobium sp. Leaf350]|uniref:DUF3180 domain-containing protein n=1 Tax=Aeromicrobium sp. Leaf350 TaxID=2876565 RepID=UPI001E370680|nr:DUF3180 domain-containing protein [Aeromicrobium sp. Leaf350]